MSDIRLHELFSGPRCMVTKTIHRPSAIPWDPCDDFMETCACIDCPRPVAIYGNQASDVGMVINVTVKHANRELDF